MKLPPKLRLVWVIALGAVLTLPSMAVRAQTEAPAAVAQPQLSAGAAEILRLVNAGVQQEVLLGFIGNSTNLFNLTGDDLIHLQNQGVPTNVTTAMLQRDQALRGTASVNNDVPPMLPAASTPFSNQPPLTPVAINEAEPAVPQFYQALAPYGTWFQLPEWGWVWQPKEAAMNRDWRPYLDDGRWAWTDHGWYWESDYPWGWAAFHYGRWLEMEKIGWVWFPDTVWAPSWVTWRYHGDNYGWAPLPPNALADHSVVQQPVVNNHDYGLQQHSYTFVNVHYIFVRNVRPHCLPPPKVREFYRHCKVVNDFGPGRHHGVVNRGIPIERVSAATGKQLTPVPVFAGGHHRRRDDGSRRSPGFTSGSQHPHTGAPGYAVPTPHHTDNRPGTRTPSPTFGLPASPRLPAAPGTPGRSGNENQGSVATPMNPIVPPMNPVIAPMNPVITPINPVTTPMNPIGSANRELSRNRSKAFAPVAPIQVVAPSVHPNRGTIHPGATPEHPGRAHGRDEERKTASHRKQDATPKAPVAAPVHPAQSVKPSHAAMPKKESWSIPVPSEEQHKHHEKRARK